MKKQGVSKKNITWLLIGIGALVLTAAVILGILLMGGLGSKPDASGSEIPVLYWNVERDQYVGMMPDGSSGRSPRSDGLYYVRLAVGGEQIDYPVADINLIQKIDQLDLMGLEFDEQGIVVGVKNVNECTGGLVASALYVQSVEGNVLHCNTQGLFKGISVDLQMTENTKVYDIGQTGLLCGIPTQVIEDAEIFAVKNYDGEIIYIYSKGYQEPGDVYWNITRMYDSKTKLSTREMSATGEYVFDMAFNGEVVTVKTRDHSIAKAIDAKAARCTGLEFDENGYVSGVTNASKLAGGTTFASWANVFEINGSEVYAKKLTGSLTGTEYFGTLSKNCKIINVSGVGGEMGSFTTLQYGDQIHGLTDNRGRVCYVWVVSRLAGNDGWKLFWNVERKYDSTAKVTKRVPAADGYYYIDVAADGQKLTVKTRNKEFVTKLDSYAARCFTMKLGADNEILKIGSANQIHGGGTFGSWYYVDKIDGNKLTVSRILTGDTVPTVLEGVMSENVEIINGSANFISHCGEYAGLNVGDRIHCLKDLNGNIRVIFIVEKTIPGPLYWNIAKKSVKNGVTTRERAEDGYFYFTMAGGGRQHTFKTKDVALATKIDSYAARCMGLVADSSGVILKVVGTSGVDGCQGGTKSMSWVDVLSVSGSTLVAQKDPKSNVETAGKIFTTKMASGCKVYNVSSNFALFCGEETTVRKGDRIHVLHNKAGDATVIFVVERAKVLDEKNSCPCSVNANWEPWDGTAPLENGKYYYLTTDVKAPAEGFLLEGIAVSLRLDGHTVSSEGRCFYLKSGGMLNICDHETRGKLIGSGVTGESGGVIRIYNTTCTVNLWNIDVERAKSDAMASEGGLISCSGTASLYNCNLSGGEAAERGGNIQLSADGTLRIFGGTVSGGKASSASSINATGRTYLEDVTVTGGTLTFNSDKEMVINGVTVEKSYAYKGNVTLIGSLQIGSMNIGAKGMLVDGGIDPGSKIALAVKPETSQTVMTGASEVGFKALSSPDPEDYVLSYEAAARTVTVTCTIVPATHTESHCVCGGNASGVDGHTCQNLSGWTELTADMLVDSPTRDNLAFPASGNYYLSLDLDLSKCIDILPDQQITLCLNGCQITGSKRIFRINGTLNLTDCTGKGQVTGKAALAPVFYTYSGGTFNFFGGTLSTAYAGSSGYWGGVGALGCDAANAAGKGSSTMNMYGGTIAGGHVVLDKDGKNGSGGSITMLASNGYTTTLNLYGGSITGGTAESMGGNVYAPAGNTVNLLGGSITGGTCKKGADVYAACGAVTVGGSVKIGSLYLPADMMLKLQTLNTNASIGILMETPGVFANSSEDLSGCFTSVDSTYQAVYSAGRLKLDLNASMEGHIHCICGGTATGMYTHACSNLLYEPWDRTDSLPDTSGNYYLTQDVVLTEASGLLVGSNDINICLNGHTVTNNNGRAFYLKNSGSSLNICNHSEQGGVVQTTGVEGESGGVVRIGSTSASFGAYNVTLRRIDTDTRVQVTEGGVITCAGKVQLYNCKVENGYSCKGGNLNLVNISKAEVIGCTFTGGEAVKNSDGENGNGGNIRIGGNNVSDPATLTLIDSTLSGGKTEAGGSGIYLVAGGASLLRLGGTVTVQNNTTDDLYMTGEGNVVLDGLSAESRIGITMKNAGVIAESAVDRKDCFLSADPALKTYFDEHLNEIYLAAEERKEPKIHQNHCICEGAQVQPEGHVCANDITWIPLTQQMFDNAGVDTPYVKLLDVLKADGSSEGKAYVLDADGYYYLDEDISYSGYPLTVTSDHTDPKEAGLCLHGYTLQCTDKRALYLKGTLHLTDCCYTDETVDQETIRNYAGRVISGMNSHAAVAYPRTDGVLNLYGGNLVDSTSGTAKAGAIVYVSGAMNLYGGSISGGYAAANGGNVNICDGAAVHVYAGRITGGRTSSGKNGGNIMVTKGELYLHGGLIADGVAANNGGNIRVDSGTVYIKGGTVRSGQATEGGNIAIKSGAQVLMDGGIVESGTATSGGNFVVFGALTVEKNALIRDGVSTGTGTNNGGGNIYGMPNTTNISITGGQITNGKANKNAANIYLRGSGSNTCYLSITGGQIGGVHPESAAGVPSVYLNKNGKLMEVSVGGDAQVDEIRFSNANMLIVEDTITQQASVGISLTGGTGTVVKTVPAVQPELDWLQIFFAAQSGKQLALDDESIVIVTQ